jgi:hypothetical protein
MVKLRVLVPTSWRSFRGYLIIKDKGQLGGDGPSVEFARTCSVYACSAYAWCWKHAHALATHAIYSAAKAGSEERFTGTMSTEGHSEKQCDA